jgi:2-polyprenyl-6-methoxyphenol hydroxylase-like FAD-dependent oxidoreductase
MSRATLLQILYNNIQGKTKILSQTGVESYSETPDGVTVTAENGERFEGSIIVGADGTHSMVRSLMAKQLESTDAVAAKNLREPFTATYHCIFCTSKNEFKNQPDKPLFPEGAFTNYYAKDRSCLMVSGQPQRLYWFFYIKSATKTATPNIPRYSAKDAEEAMERYAEDHIATNVQMKDLWDSRISYGIAPMEEGVVKTKWNRGRAVLLGDAAHKVGQSGV